MSIANTISDTVNAALGKSGGLSAAIDGSSDSVDDIYKMRPENWYKTLPYGFIFWDRNASSDKGGSGSTIFYLPISPNNINVVTHFATNIVTTLYGVVEEHSEVRYYDITISGTTGFTPRFNKEKSNRKSDSVQNALDVFDPKKSKEAAAQSSAFINPTGRHSFDNSSIVNLSGFLPEVTNVISQVANKASEIGDFLSGGPSMETGVTPFQNGYVAFHNFYRFLLKYKKDAAGHGKAGNKTRGTGHPLQFLNYKDNIKYDCIPTDFTLTRSAESPMLYNYTIKMRCFNLSNVSDKLQEQNQLTKLGLGKVESQNLFSSLAGAAGGAATLASGFL